jgi:hypothetical protein
MTAYNYPPSKPSGNFHLAPGPYKRLDVPRIVARKDGRIDYELYLHLDYRLIDKTRPGILRVKVVREPFHGQPEDPTGYGHIWLPVGGESMWVPFTHTPWEIAEKDRDVWVELDVENANVTIGTRYFKAHQP